MVTYQFEFFNSIASTLASLVALIVSIIALVYTTKTYLLKAGAYIRGSYSICSSISCDDKYVHNLKLENLKDRAIVIFKIYLKVGHNYFIEIDDFDGNPLILKPFEIFSKEYDPLDLYSAGTGRILLNGLLDDKSAKRQIVLSTSEGKYTVKEYINYWDAIGTYFQNYETVIIQPMRSVYKEKSYGSNAKFIVELKMEGGNDEVIPIYSNDYERRRFVHFSFTKESLLSKEALEEYLYERVIEGSLKCADVTVIELDKWRNEIYKSQNKRVFTAKYESWLAYHVLGRLGTIVSDYRLKKQNQTLKPKEAPTKHSEEVGDSAASTAESTPKQNTTPKPSTHQPDQH